MEDIYHTLVEESTFYLKEKGSKFYGYAFPIESIEDFESRLDQIKKEHHKASHHCYAYRIGDQNLLFRSSDDGEPSGTAGLPILGQIDSFGLTDLAVIVVRYFGGTKLGASGLIKTYRLTAKETLYQSNIVKKIRYQTYLLRFEYLYLNKVMNYLKEKQIEIVEHIMTDEAQIKVALPQGKTTQIIIELKAHLTNDFIENIDYHTAISGFKMERFNKF
jgi:uncharacterized YigZ family protein